MTKRTFFMLLAAMVLSLSLATAQTEKKPAVKKSAATKSTCCMKATGAKECTDKSGKCTMSDAKASKDCPMMKASDKKDCSKMTKTSGTMDCCKNKAKADAQSDKAKEGTEGTNEQK